jgi:ABC-type multidrug transport system fused ATPase/permease subunit
MPLLGWRATLRDVAALWSRAAMRRLPGVVALTLVERLVAPALTWVLFAGTLREKIALGMALSGVFLVRTVAQKAVVVRAEAELLERTATSVLHGDVLAENLLPDEDARLELVQAIYNTSIALAQTLPNALADAMACAALVVTVAVVEPARIASFAGAIMLVSGVALVVSRRWIDWELERSWGLQRRVNEMFWDVLEGRVEIVASGRRAAFMAELGSRTTAWSAAGVRLATATALSGRLPLLAVAALVALAFFADARIRGSLTAFTLADVALFASVTPAFAGLAQGVYALAGARRWTSVVARVVGRAHPDTGRGSAAPSFPSSVVFDRVSFRYQGAKSGNALDGASFTWSGEGPLALAGPNGSGKSTCLRLLLLLGQPSAGALTVAGVPVHRLDADAWRKKAAYLPQRPYLPPRSDIRAAIRWLAPDATDERILGALDRVGLLPSLHQAGSEPLEALVDSLSSGQRQRVALARLLCRDVSLFVLDEPDANLDRAGVALVGDILRELAGRAMVAYAAHTPELLRIADRVVMLEGGRVLGEEAKPVARAVGPVA